LDFIDKLGDITAKMSVL